MVKRIESLTEAQKGRFGEYKDKWIKVGFTTGDADFETFGKYVRVAYQKAEQVFPEGKLFTVQSPLEGALAASFLEAIMSTIDGRCKGKRTETETIGVENIRALRNACVQKMKGAESVEMLSGSPDTWIDEDFVTPPNVRVAVSTLVGKVLEGTTYPTGVSVDEIVKTAFSRDKLQWHAWLWGQFEVGGWWGSVAAVSFFTEVCDLELEPDVAERALAYRRICESVNFWWPNTYFCLVCDRPQRISRNVEGQLHNDAVKAIVYKDDWGLYVLDGIAIPPPLFRKIRDQEVSLSDLMKIEDAEIRAVALKYSPGAILKEQAELIRTGSRGDELFLVKGQEINRLTEFDEMYFLRMKCPTGRVYIEAVDPAVARKTDDPSDLQAYAFGVKPEVYRNLAIEG